MINDNKKITVYLNVVVDKIFKILPLYEEKNIGIKVYVESLIFELYGVQNVITIENSSDYISLLSTLESVRAEMNKENIKKYTLKRELFKCINLVKNISSNLEKSD